MINIFKIGGNVINNDSELKKFLKDFAAIPGEKILVHGGGREATSLGNSMGIQAKMIDGRRVTDEATLKLVTMVYAGLINKRIVSMLQEYGCNAVGLTGADGKSIPASKRNPKPIDFGFVGDINPNDINTDFINILVENAYVPVFCAICYDKDGGLLNCNADSIASALAQACSKLQPTNLYYCFEKPGVLADVDDENSVIPLVTPSMFDEMVDKGLISGGMIPKVSNALKAVEAGVNSVTIRSSIDIVNPSGTIIRK